MTLEGYDSGGRILVSYDVSGEAGREAIEAFRRPRKAPVRQVGPKQRDRGRFAIARSRWLTC